MSIFKLSSEFMPKGDQQGAIDRLVSGLADQKKFQTLLGVTGSGKTFTMAKVIEKIEKPTLVMVHNKTLAGQLYHEFKTFFPENAVGYFVSYYDYYQPEAYLPTTDTFIEKDSSINETIDQMRHQATSSLFERNDVIIVSSVSCIYGLGSPEAYHGMLLYLEVGNRVDREEILKKLVEIQYDRNDIDFYRGTFRVRGDVIEIFPASSDSNCVRISLFGDEVESIEEIDPLRGAVIKKLPKIAIYPGSHYVIPPDRIQTALRGIEQELEERIFYFEKEKKLVEAQRIEQRTRFDLEMIKEMGFCQGIENYSRHLSGRTRGEPPPTLIDYFPDGFLLMADESHATIPQVRGMFEGDFSRKKNLVEYGFRLPSAFDNRPLKFDEFEKLLNQVIFVSATPGPYELKKCHREVVEQIIRPTGLIDPEITVKPAKGQVDDLLDAIHLRVSKNERVLVTTLTKRMAEDLTEYYHELGIKVRYLHSEIETLERTEILRDLRLGKFDVLVGINLLREGLDLPEVSLVAILDADKEGFLRSHRSLIQTIGRAARHVHGEVFMYADRITDSMREAIQETNRRREIQIMHNKEHHIIPVSVTRGIPQALYGVSEADYFTLPFAAETAAPYIPQEELGPVIKSLEKEMRAASNEMNFEKAAEIRDKIKALKESALSL
ncbi:MAG: excinuclease ABC subunit UvrB [Nitrospiria bacterium]